MSIKPIDTKITTETYLILRYEKHHDKTYIVVINEKTEEKRTLAVVYHDLEVYRPGRRVKITIVCDVFEGQEIHNEFIRG